jgi:4-aminobutyrate aminotransferase-like enzyme/Ser/Thr protein kinase RdoA (MazF antagonist)/murein DD-endopeptidase MepM/ murein hydrolase activator NlpD
MAETEPQRRARPEESSTYAHWREVLEDRWRIDARLTRLDGEYDLNFLALGDDAHILKIMRAGCDPGFVDMQCRALEQIRASALHADGAGAMPVPEVVHTESGDLFTTVIDETGQPRIAWLLSKLPGVHYAYWRPHTAALAYRVGNAVGAMDRALADFEHPSLERSFKWNPTKALWIGDRYEDILDPRRRSIVDGIVDEYRSVHGALSALPSAAIHNDVNDHNILVDGSLITQARVSGLIDFGDMCAAPRICELANTGAYLVLDAADPEAMLSSLVEGYHAAYPITPAEVDLIWPLLRMRLAVSVVNSALMAIERPDDPYVVISQKPAWDFLDTNRVSRELIGPRLRAACGLPVTDTANHVTRWLEERRGTFAPVLGRELSAAPMRSLSVQSSTTPRNPLSIAPEEAAELGAEIGADDPVWLGYYCEPRLIYTEKTFRKGPSPIGDRRTVHIGIDAFAAAGTPVHTPLEATVAFVGDRAGYLDYGGVVILRHETPNGAAFFTLYGHLAPRSLAGLQAGRRLKEGESFAVLGEVSENGGWRPHLHFQLALTTAGFDDDWPGVADPDELFLLREIFPNPAALLNLADEKTAFRTVDRSAVLRDRLEKFGANLKLSYAEPVMFLRGWKHYLFDEWGRPYLDCYNNVPHVGHSHPRIQAVAAAQLERLNSNTRYLHPAQVAFADKILSKMPEQLSVCYFVNSGSEANELALRLARAHTGGLDMVTPDHGYHGNTTGAISISAYKFNAPGGIGQPDWVQLVEVADDYRGSFRRDDPDRAEKYAALVDGAITNIEARGGRLAGFIAETFPSVGGQIIPPEGYLPAVYRRIRAAGGVCIADEVQTGLGRLGDYYFGFEQQGAVPDIVVLGKPIGNGFPLGVVVTTRDIAASFAQSPEFFSTFGGSTLSCVIGKDVLDIVDDEGLMENAREVGGYLLERLRALQDAHDFIGDVRGFGLFIGVELVESRTTMKEAPRIASYIKNRMRENRILIGTEGPADNILKIRPPLTFDRESADVAIRVIEGILGEGESHLRR